MRFLNHKPALVCRIYPATYILHTNKYGGVSMGVTVMGICRDIAVVSDGIIFMSMPKIRRMFFLYYAVSFGVFANVTRLRQYTNEQGDY